MEKTSSIDSAVLDGYMKCLLAGNRVACEQVVRDLLEAGTELTDVYEGLFQASLYRVGDLWESHQISVATEHMMTAISEGLLNRIFMSADGAPRVGRSALFACIEQEHHQVGLKIVADLFELHGWDTCFVGANAPTDDLIETLKQRLPHVLGLSTSIPLGAGGIELIVADVTEALPELPILIGGQGLAKTGEDLAAGNPNVRHLANIQGVVAFLGRSSP